MTPDHEIHTQLSGIRDKLGDVDATVRVAKHETANIAQRLNGSEVRIDKLEARFEKFDEKTSEKLEVIIQRIADINTSHQKSMSFYAGVAAVFTVGGGLLLAIGKLLFGPHL